MRLRTDEKDLGRFDYSPLFELLKQRATPLVFITHKKILFQRALGQKLETMSRSPRLQLLLFVTILIANPATLWNISLLSNS